MMIAALLLGLIASQPGTAWVSCQRKIERDTEKIREIERRNSERLSEEDRKRLLEHFPEWKTDFSVPRGETFERFSQRLQEVLKEPERATVSPPRSTIPVGELSRGRKPSADQEAVDAVEGVSNKKQPNYAQSLYAITNEKQFATSLRANSDKTYTLFIGRSKQVEISHEVYQGIIKRCPVSKGSTEALNRVLIEISENFPRESDLTRLAWLPDLEHMPQIERSAALEFYRSLEVSLGRPAPFSLAANLSIALENSNRPATITKASEVVYLRHKSLSRFREAYNVESFLFSSGARVIEADPKNMQKVLAELQDAKVVVVIGERTPELEKFERELGAAGIGKRVPSFANLSCDGVAARMPQGFREMYAYDKRIHPQAVEESLKEFSLKLPEIGKPGTKGMQWDRLWIESVGNAARKATVPALKVEFELLLKILRRIGKASELPQPLLVRAA